MSKWIMQDVPNRRCLKHIVTNGGQWDLVRQVWVFDSAEAAANALSGVYCETRATRRQRYRLIEMIVDGTALAAWPVPFHRMTIEQVDDVSADDAGQFITLGATYRRGLLERFIGQMPPTLVAKRFNVAAFERGVEARRARLHHAPHQRLAA